MSEDPAAFVACASHPRLGDEEARGRIVFERLRLRFVSETFAFEIPLAQLEISKGEPGDERVYFSDPAQPGCLIYTFDGGILGSRALLGQPHTRNQIRTLQSGEELKRRLKITLGVVAGFAVVALIASVAMGIMVRSLVARIPVEWEQELGDKAVDEIKPHLEFVQEPKLMQRVIDAVAPLTNSLPHNGVEFKFYIFQHPLPNAFALPGGHVFLTTSLLDLADRPEEIAGVVAHEVAHVTQKHGFRKIISAAGPYLICQVFMREGNGLLGVLGDGSQMLISQGFSQEYEFEADAVGWDSLVAAGIDPRGLTEMLRKLELAQRNFPKADMEIGALNSHPDTAKRIRRLEAKWAALKNKSQFGDYNRP